MFDLGASEILLIVIVAIFAIGPKDIPLAMRTAGRWIGKLRKVSGHFRAGLDAMVREAELEEMEKEWKRRNAGIMAGDPGAGDREMVEPALMEPLAGPVAPEKETRRGTGDPEPRDGDTGG